MKQKVYTLKDASKILGLSVKTLYARIKSEKYKHCFVIVKDAPKQFLYYKAECIEKELNNRVNERDKAKLIDLYFEVADLLEDKGFDSQKEIRKKIKIHLNETDKDNKYLIDKILNCNPVDKDELNYFIEILEKIKQEL